MAQEDNGTGVKTVAVATETYQELVTLKVTPRQSFDEVIVGLIALWRKERGTAPVIVTETPA